jgi:hypothetical protein
VIFSSRTWKGGRELSIAKGSAKSVNTTDDPEKE